MRTLSFGLDDIRTILHLLGVVVWLGGQIVMLTLLPVLRRLGGDATRLAAAAWGRVAWGFFGLAIITGIWNMFEVDMTSVSSGWNITFGIKFLLVIVTGAAAFVHQKADSAALKGITGALGFGAALGAFILGVALSH